MSYILDALRRAQAERERGQVPGLDARTLVVTPPPQPRRRAGLLWLGAGLVLAALGLSVALLMRDRPQPALGVVPGTAGQLPQAQAAPPALAAASAPPVPAPPAMVVVSAAALPPRPSPAPPSPVAVDTGVRAVSLAQLSPEVRRELPPLALGGAIWSDNVASRFVIVNGQVLREGDAAAPGVVLERIGPKAVYLRWRDWRIEIPI
jgi:general secretion pathway protein B